ncbi:glycosyltransferase family 2 protein [Sabulicella glaciei]|uniref:Glycosyltransferase family 2 protein n=1 Tax=Sabulicella glaciei TaxID=2984948 RepID=A0ABT3NRZ7_9PROT|nr:glycosyltransferase family 2 protein [Roseococcus sp. MDT2-1-1]MCW8084935.1 glycosyltransferase family 2 protein [Roseococcus sp. MDT2-1-1]
MPPATPRIAVLVPCHNEALTVAEVVRGFRAALPGAVIYVYDNNSTDGTAEVARAARAEVRFESRPGKGSVVRRMFADIEADWYVMVDGDATYDASAAPLLIAAAAEGRFDMVNAAREETGHGGAYRPGHRFGNRVLTGLVGRVFGTQTRDMLSGYKVFSRRFVKSFPAMSAGFEIETELMIHALELRLPVGEIAAPYGERPEGSTSKLSTWRDGFVILRLIGVLVQRERPFEFFSILAGLLAVVALGLGLPVVFEFIETGLVPRLPTAVLASALILSALLSFAVGLILQAITHSRREMKRLAYLALGSGALSAAAPSAKPEPTPSSAPSRG